MLKTFLKIIAFLIIVIIGTSVAGKRIEKTLLPRIHHQHNRDSRMSLPAVQSNRVPASVDTFILGYYTFDGPSGLDPQGWTGGDFNSTVITDTFFHVADASELTGGEKGLLMVIEGSQSLWCGAAPAPSGDLCRYATLPGYGNHWQQYFQSIKFSHIGDVVLSFITQYDSEPAEDFSYVQYLNKDGYWEELAQYDRLWPDPVLQRERFVIPDTSLGDSVQVRFYFSSDGAWSDQDGLWPTDGAIVIDSLFLTDDSGVISFQNFENEQPGQHNTSDEHWQAHSRSTFGNFSGLFPGMTVLQEDKCRNNLSALWGFFNGSTDDYSCAGHPEQTVLPYGIPGSYNFEDFLSNEIWSPVIDWHHDRSGTSIPASAEQVLFEFDVYRDLSVNALVFYQWKMREFIGSCAQEWVGNRFVYYGNRKDWYRHQVQIGGYIDPGADSIQVALAAVDMCAYWCGFYGDGSCHSHAPLFDNIRIVRIDIAGPIWDTPDSYLWLFQDNFAADGTLTGTVPLDGPPDVYGSGVPDAARIYVTSPAGIDRHFPGDILTGPAVYCHIKDVSPEKSGVTISGDPAVYHWIMSNDGWTVLQCRGTDSGQEGPHFNIDLNDELYQPGDTIQYYFSARDVNGVTTYWNGISGALQSEAEARADPIEVTCLPANALNGATEILYVDGFDGYGAEPYFDNAFDLLGITPDRFDVVDPAFNTNGGLGSRVVDVAAQLSSVYKTIIWNTGYFRYGGIHDGTKLHSNQSSSDDFGVLYAFLDQSMNRPSVYLSGDNLATWWLTRTGMGAVDLRSSYMNFDVTSSSHTDAGETVSPLVIGMPGSCFDHWPDGLDLLLAYGGGCAGINDFDVLEPFGSAQPGMLYMGDDSHAAVLTQMTPNSAGDVARVVLSGFSFHVIRDPDPNSPFAAAEHLQSILTWFEHDVGDPTGIAGQPPRRTALMQNYPNPFNPGTVIEYELARTMPVRLSVYDVAGRLVRVLVDAEKSAGKFAVEWNGRDRNDQPVASGVYFCRLQAGTRVMTQKMVLLK